MSRACFNGRGVLASCSCDRMESKRPYPISVRTHPSCSKSAWLHWWSGMVVFLRRGRINKRIEDGKLKERNRIELEREEQRFFRFLPTCSLIQQYYCQRTNRQSLGGLNLDKRLTRICCWNIYFRGSGMVGVCLFILLFFVGRGLQKAQRGSNGMDCSHSIWPLYKALGMAGVTRPFISVANSAVPLSRGRKREYKVHQSLFSFHTEAQ